MKQKALTVEQKEDLRELVQLDGFKVALQLLELLKESQERDVLTCQAEDERKLVRLKCRAEGSAKLLTDFKQQLDNLKAKERIQGR